MALIVAVWWVTTQSPLVRWVVSSRLAAATGLKLEQGSIKLGFTGHVQIKDAIIRTPGIDGPGGELITFERLDATVSWPALLGFGGSAEPVKQILLISPRVRLSQNASDGTLNVAVIKLPESRDASKPITLPLVQIDQGVIELGEHGGNGERDTFTLLKHIDVRGRIEPASPGADGSIDVVLTPDAKEAQASPLRISGEIKGRDLSMELGGVTLKDWPMSAMPTRMRVLAEMLDVEGQIGRTTFTYSPSRPGGAAVTATTDLVDVALNLPITEDAQVTDSAQAPLLRMSHVNGRIEFSSQGVKADLVGSIEEVPYRVSLSYDGIEQNSPFTAKVSTQDFRMEKGLRILRFVPPLVRERLADFNWPTGLVTTDVVISRPPPVDGSPAPLSVVGDLEVKDAVSAFKRFPYEFEKLSGKVKFSDTRIDLLDIRGVSKTGAKIQASGFIEPPTDDAHCVIDVQVEGLKIDQDVIRALTARRKGIPPVIFNQTHYTRMLAAGLLAAPGDQTAEPSVPRFALDGLAKVRTVVTRPAGKDTEWLENTDIDFDFLTVLPEWFPFPMIAHDVAVRIGEDRIRVFGGEYRPIVGGHATATADVDYELVINPEKDGSPVVTVNAADVPAGRLLSFAVGAAIERANRNDPGGSAGPRIRGILDDLNPSGLVAGELRLYNDDQERGHVYAKVDVGPTILTPTPEVEVAAAEVVDDASQLEVAAQGTVTIQDREVLFDFTGQPRVKRGDRVDFTESSNVHVRGRSGPDASGESVFNSTVDAEGIDLAAPLHQMIGVFSPMAAGRWYSLAADYQPAGKVFGKVEITPGTEGSVATVTAERFEDLSIAFEGRATLVQAVEGRVIVEPTGAVRFDDFAANLVGGAGATQGQAQGRIAVEGAIAAGDAEGETVPSPDFKATLTSARAEAPILRALACRRLSEENAELLTQLNPRGEFDASFTMQAGAGAAGAPGLVGLVRPRSMTIFMNGMDVPFEKLTGEVTFSSQGGQLRAVEGTSELFSLRTDGSWSRNDLEETEIDITLSGRSQGLPATLRALLPESVRGIFTTIEFDVADEVELPVMQLRITDSTSPEHQRLLAGGKVNLRGASLSLGVPVTECSGVLEFRVENNDFRTPAGFGLEARLDRFKVSGLAMERGMVQVRGRPDTGELTVERVIADCYGGRFVAKAVVGRPGSGPRDFQADFSLSGVRFAPMLRDLTVAAGKPLEENPPADDDASRGLVDAQLAIGGRLEDAKSRRGRGSARISGPSVLRMPLVMPLIRFSNFQLPTDEPLDFADAKFYIDGPVLAFEDLSVFSKSVHILGFGTMTWPGMALDLRFNSKAVRRIPVLNWLLEGIRNEIVTTQVTGTLGKPDVASVPFDNTRRFFLQIFGSGMNDQERRMLELGKTAEQSR
ncbi:MAG TPA: hypothetical protein VK176_06535 [Phycisphaerales bacterium]|nr:hypothetical protein [Phycisphaerales bacterium]